MEHENFLKSDGGGCYLAFVSYEKRFGNLDTDESMSVYRFKSTEGRMKGSLSIFLQAAKLATKRGKPYNIKNYIEYFYDELAGQLNFYNYTSCSLPDDSFIKIKWINAAGVFESNEELGGFLNCEREDCPWFYYPNKKEPSKRGWCKDCETCIG